jgi:hypothetical protein
MASPRHGVAEEPAMIGYTWAVLVFVVGSAFGGIVIALAIGLIKPPAAERKVDWLSAEEQHRLFERA